MRRPRVIGSEQEGPGPGSGRTLVDFRHSRQASMVGGMVRNYERWGQRGRHGCICYLPLHNKSPQSLVKSSWPVITRDNLRGSGIWEQLSWVVLGWDLPGGCSQALSRVCTHLKAWLGMGDPLPTWLTLTATVEDLLVHLFTGLLECPPDGSTNFPQSKQSRRDQDGNSKYLWPGIGSHSSKDSDWLRRRPRREGASQGIWGGGICEAGKCGITQLETEDGSRVLRQTSDGGVGVGGRFPWEVWYRDGSHWQPCWEGLRRKRQMSGIIEI